MTSGFASDGAEISASMPLKMKLPLNARPTDCAGSDASGKASSSTPPSVPAATGAVTV